MSVASDKSAEAVIGSGSNPRTLSGVVTSNSMQQTIVVQIERRVRHPVYGKVVRRSNKIHAHDENNECEVGDVVTVREVAPISKTKTWRLISIDVRSARI